MVDIGRRKIVIKITWYDHPKFLMTFHVEHFLRMGMLFFLHVIRL